MVFVLMEESKTELLNTRDSCFCLVYSVVGGKYIHASEVVLFFAIETSIFYSSICGFVFFLYLFSVKHHIAVARDQHGESVASHVVGAAQNIRRSLDRGPNGTVFIKSRYPTSREQQLGRKHFEAIESVG